MQRLSFLPRLAFWLFCLAAGAAHAALDPALVNGLAGDDSDAKLAAVEQVTQLPEETARRILNALNEDALVTAGGQLFILRDGAATDPETGAPVTAPADAESVTLNNRVRRELNGALAALRLVSANRDTRLSAAREFEASADADMAPKLAKALEKETDREIKRLLALAHARATLESADAAERLAAVKTLGGSGNPGVKQLLENMLEKKGADFAEPDAGVRAEAAVSLKAVQSRLSVSENISRAFTGLSLGSILLLAALGLAITYGVMGVINMAHGELLMIGAYTTFAVQSLFRAYAPQSLDWYVVAAVPASFFAAAVVGMVMERTVIRHLYGRPLETLLATWGLSLVLIQGARTLFGAQNVEVANPAWMSGGVELMANVVLPWNRVVIIAFSAGVVLLVWALMNLTRLGMFVRAVTQNRAMAGCVGVPTGRVDTMAFGIGAGIAGLGGCALSQIANVGPDMGQGYIVDSFMVVVLGGVGQLAGAVWAALGLGVLTKFLEGWTGAVIAKIAVLVFIIIFIQKRPQGLFALKGRFVES
ncbi:MAG: urea ABC transporter permease subunit UrtB [Rhodocyclaceae bacterium]